MISFLARGDERSHETCIARDKSIPYCVPSIVLSLPERLLADITRDADYVISLWRCMGI
jgi:hypothetical protein